MIGAHESFHAQPTTIGRLLSADPLAVPRFQREYSWTEDEVDKLLRDFTRAQRKGPESYFLGSIVLASGSPIEVIDGQQRLATSSILLACLRDVLIELGKESQAESIENQFLRQTEFEDGRLSPRLKLNVDDRGFFWQAIVCRVGSKERSGVEPRFDSHRRILDAQRVVRQWIDTALGQASDASDKLDIISGWRRFLHEYAVVASLLAKDRRRAFRMFVTLNDRGLQVTQTDLVKNHLFEKADEQFELVQSAWTQVRSTLEALDLEDTFLHYLRHFLAMKHGLVREEEIFDKVEDGVTNERESVHFAEQLAEIAGDYAAIHSPSHSRWRQHRRIRALLVVLNEELQVKFHRALLLSIVAHFPDGELQETVRWLTALSVRMLIVGGTRSGKTEEAISEAAKKVADGEISTLPELSKALSKVTPGDATFASGFRYKRIDKPRIARYLLRSIEAHWRQEESPETSVVDDPNVVNLEHLLPKRYPQNGEWPHFSPDEHRAYATRLGNMVLVRSDDNSSAGQLPFAQKRPMLETAAQNITTTRDVLEHVGDECVWTADDIDARQQRLAEAAVEVWSCEI